VHINTHTHTHTYIHIYKYNVLISTVCGKPVQHVALPTLQHSTDIMQILIQGITHIMISLSSPEKQHK